ncbi:hypothetical protein MMC09_003718 [Bachmanniomyces sp. S44760]|nr:hypothetical protein [Bachmanniomyces sp. S44760]
MPVTSLHGMKIVGAGISGTVFAIDDMTVIKVTAGQDGIRDQEIESRVYQRLGYHPRIVRYLRSEPRGLILERLKEPLRKRLQELQADGKLPSKELIYKWSRHIIEGLRYLHEKSVLQSDLGCHNLLMDENDNIKYCDFAGCSIDGEESWVCYELRSQRPSIAGEIPGEVITVSTEIFALGSALYEISTTTPPYKDESDETITERFKSNRFPQTESLELGSIISKCWRGKYATTSEVLEDFDRTEQDLHQDVTPRRSPNINLGWWFMDMFHFVPKIIREYVLPTSCKVLLIDRCP